MKRKNIPYARQNINNLDINAVVKVLQSEMITQGPVNIDFESYVSNYCNSKYALSFNSATSALHGACKALNIRENDIVWTSPITFVSTANSAIYCGARVNYIDIDPETFNISVKCLGDQLKNAKKEKTLPKVIIVVHLGGLSCDMKEIYKLSKIYGFKIIEDASHAIGGEYDKNKIGSCKYSDICVFSFHPVKIITSAEGGMALTNKSSLARHLSLFRTHGITRDPSLFSRKKEGAWYYEQISDGFNYRMNELQAALGLSQMKRIDKFIKKRQLLARNYNKLLANLPISNQKQSDLAYSSYHLYIVRLKNFSKDSHRKIFSLMRDNGILVNLHYIPVYKHPFHKKQKTKFFKCIQAENYYKEAISLPMYYDLTKDEQNRVVKTFKRILLSNI